MLVRPLRIHSMVLLQQFNVIYIHYVTYMKIQKPKDSKTVYNHLFSIYCYDCNYNGPIQQLYFETSQVVKCFLCQLHRVLFDWFNYHIISNSLAQHSKQSLYWSGKVFFLFLILRWQTKSSAENLISESMFVGISFRSKMIIKWPRTVPSWTPLRLQTTRPTHTDFVLFACNREKSLFIMNLSTDAFENNM